MHAAGWFDGNWGVEPGNEATLPAWLLKFLKAVVRSASGVYTYMHYSLYVSFSSSSVHLAS